MGSPIIRGRSAVLGAEGGWQGWDPRNSDCPGPVMDFRQLWVWKVYEVKADEIAQGSLKSLLLSPPQARGCFFPLRQTLNSNSTLPSLILQPSEDCVKNVSGTRPSEHPTLVLCVCRQQTGISCGAAKRALSRCAWKHMDTECQAATKGLHLTTPTCTFFYV